MAKKSKTNGHGGMGHNSKAVSMLWLRRSYNDIERDPEIDRFHSIFNRERIKEDDLAAVAGVATTTVKNMFDGTTRSPRHSTFAKLAGGMGYKYGLTRDEDQKPNYEKEIPKAREERKGYRAFLAKKREREERNQQKK
jgi:hypothetical protein